VRAILNRLLREAAWAPAAVLFAHQVAGHFFGHEPYVDPVMHFLGGVAATFFFRRAAAIGRDRIGGLTCLGLDVFSFTLTCSIAVFWEIGEFTSDKFVGSHVQRGLGNTMRDLILGISGAIVFLLFQRLAERFRK